MTRRSALLVWLVGVVIVVSGCATTQTQIPPGTLDADKFLFDRGQEELRERRWVRAREFFRQIVDNYPQSPYRPDAKLAVGDSYIGEGSTEARLLAVNEFREFLTFFPTNPRADYAQYRLAYAYSEQMLAPDRDQTATRDTIRELQVFLDRYPNSSLMPEARKLMREAQDRLSESGYRIGLTYYRMRHYLGAINRFREVLKLDPEYTGRDAVYYHLAESLLAMAKQSPDKSKAAEALPYYERILQEFEQSQYMDDARKRIAELKVE
jgi:outer membrane protein assembly factor BamD